ncbi:P4Hc [Seminavis robusta]|uniref:P4Hc n=1 Tax=Seminavis robusta TaxID=568900 RepID=A0A9N8D9B5_9STRA|nr:P4Hc [Seminavis robusta]|eukprot:Sro6_g005470.1 P4Hc (299) ;mRNA; r:194883-195779
MRLLFLLVAVGSVSCFVVPNQASISKRLPPLSASISATPTGGVIITNQQLQDLARNDYVVIPNFLSKDLQESLRQDVKSLRDEGHFSVAKIGQDSTNTLNQQIRQASTCFIGGATRENLPSNAARSNMISVLEQVCQQLSDNASLLASPRLDNNLSELLYAYYPTGGFYRRHRDAISGSASVLRTFSLLLYLNQDWTPEDAGNLRMHMDSGGDELPAGEEPNFLDVAPEGGTLVLFDSAKIPHEVLDTNSERLAIVGWYNRELAVSDIAELGGADPIRMAMLAVAAGLVTVGLVNILS